MQSKANNKSVKTNAILNITKTIGALIFPLFTFPYSAHVLGVDAVGKYNFSTSIISYFILLAGLGVAMYGVREGTKYRDDPSKISQFCSEVFSINIYSAILSYALLFLCVFFIPKLHAYSILILILSLRIILTTINCNWIYNIFEDFLVNTIVTIVMDIAGVIAMLLFVHSPSDLYIYVLISALAYNGYGLFQFFYVRNYVDLHFVVRPDLKHLKPIVVIFSMEIGAAIYIDSDITILGWLGGDSVTGLYSTASYIYQIVKQVLNALIMVVIPRFSYYIGNEQQAVENGDQAQAEEYKKSAELLGENLIDSMLTFCLPCMIGLILMAEPIVNVIAGADFAPATTSLQLLSLALIFAMMEGFYGNCILISFKKEMIFFMLTFIAALINIVLNFILIPIYMQNAAAFTTIIAEAFMGITTYFVSRKSIRITFHFKTLWKVLLGCAGIALNCYLMKLTIKGNVVYLLAGVISSIVIYALIEVIVKNHVVDEMLQNFISKVKSIRKGKEEKI